MQLSRFIDHTLLKPETTQSQIEALCEEAIQHEFYSVCVNSSYVPLCAKKLADSKTKVCCVIGFPLGAMDTLSKSFESQTAIENGATEIDMVIHIGALKDKNIEYVHNDIAKVVAAARGHIVKVIIETALLTDDEKILACQLAVEAGAHFVKTSTGFAGGGANVADVQLMKKVVGGKAQVKASGGIKDHQHALALIQAGATRLGTSSGIAIIQGGTVQGGY